MYKVIIGILLLLSMNNLLVGVFGDEAADIYAFKDGQSQLKTFMVRGRVAKADGSPLAGLQVVAIEKTIKSEYPQGEHILGNTRTEKDGSYAIYYTSRQLANPVKGKADLVVRVYDDQSKEPVASSPLILNALDQEVINLSVGEESYRGRSEYEFVAERMQPLLKQAKKKDFSDQEIAYFSNQTGLILEQVHLYIESQKQSQRTKIKGSILYALYRTGMPYSLAALTVQNPEAIHTSLKQAQEKNIIAPLEDEEVVQVVEDIQRLGVTELLESNTPTRVQGAKLLELANFSVNEKALVLKAYAAGGEQGDKFWEQLGIAGLEKSKIEKLQRLMEFNAVSLGHLPLVEKLAADERIKSLKDLASKDVEGWKAFLIDSNIPAPDQMPGENPEEKQSNYALILARIMEDTFPTAYFSSGWSRDASLDGDIKAFFDQNPDFAFEETGINTYLKEDEEKHPLEGFQDKKAVTLKLQALQNLFRLSPSFQRLDAVKALWQDKVYSAFDIKAMGEEKFVAKYEERIGKARAKLIYAKAEKVAGFALLALAKYSWDANAIKPDAIPMTDLSLSGNMPEEYRAKLRDLFGNMDFSQCPSYHSVLGPAAYLVDLLMFLNNSKAQDENKSTGLEKFFTRRPDIGNIKLNDENINTLIPYIDLVNEVLEDAIVPRDYEGEAYDSTNIFTGDVYQTEEKRSEILRAHQEHIKRAAYDDNLAQAIYPWTLPFNLWTEESRAYLAQLGVKHHELMEVFRGPDAPTETEILCEALGMTPLELTLLTNGETDESRLKKYWGIKSGSLPGAVEKVTDFLSQTGINYPQLDALIQCHFINPPGAYYSIGIEPKNPSSLDDAKLTNLTMQKLDHLHRFIRLQHKLGWSFFDLDKTLTAFGKRDIDYDFLEKLSFAIPIIEQLGVDRLTGLSWWSRKLDAVEYKDTPSQYSELFKNRAVGDLKEEVRNTLELKFNPVGEPELSLPTTPLKLTDPDYEPVVLGAAGIRKDDLTLIIGGDLGSDDKLNLANLSHVVRVASFSRAVGLSIQEYYILSKLCGIRPLTIPAHGTTPQHIAMPQDTRAFLEAKQAVAESGIRLAELAYLLDHNTSQPDNGQLLEQVIVQRLTEIRTNLAAIYADHQMPSEGQKTVLMEKLSESLSVSAAAAYALLESIKNPADSDQSAQDVFLKEAFISDTKPIDKDSEQFLTYERIYKASRLLNGLAISPDDQAFALRQDPAMGWVDFNALPVSAPPGDSVPTDLFARCVRMVKVFQVWPRICTSGTPLSAFLSQTTKSGATEEQIRQLLVANTAWSLNDIQTLTTKYAYSLDDLRKSEWLVQLYKAFSILKRLGVSAEQAWSWNTAEVTFEQSAQIKLAVKSKYDNQEWLSIAPAIRDPLREKQRNALLAYVIHEGVPLDPLNPEGGRKVFMDADDVYGYLLIDPQMSACQDTSRIKQAISSVQLFVQRILMGLEADNKVEFTYADAKHWNWRKNYRIWEANRKVFLWPENWIYPDLRNDKSPFFKELEDELAQSDIDNDSAERALMSYLKKLDEVAHLEISGLYEEIDEDAGQYILHVVARTQGTPHKYFYRRWMNKQYWTAWERVEADIEGDHLIPVVHNRRLFLFWPKFMEKAEEVKGSDMADIRQPNKKPSDSSKYYEIYMAWTQYRDGKWRETQVSTDSFKTKPMAQLPEKKDFYFFAEQMDGGELLLCVTDLVIIRYQRMKTDSQFKPRDEDTFEGTISWEPGTGGGSGGGSSGNTGGDTDKAPEQISFEKDAILYSDITDAIPVQDSYECPTLNNLNKLPDGDNIFMEFGETINPRELRLMTEGEVDGFGTIKASTVEMATLLDGAEAGFRLMLPQQYPTYISQAPFFYSDSKRVFFVQPQDVWMGGDSLDSVAETFSPPENTYFPDVAATIRENSFRLAKPGPWVKEERPFFDSDRAYYVGNKASGIVIDRTKTPPGLVADTAIAPEDSTQPAPATDTDVIGIIKASFDREGFHEGLMELGWGYRSKKYSFRSFYHPYVPLMIKQLNRYGVEGLFAPTSDHGNGWEELKRQQKKGIDDFTKYMPASNVAFVPSKEDFDFNFGDAYSQYNWEIFFHVPLLIAERLMQNQKFEEAQKWFHYIFKPTETEGLAPKRFWQIKPFYEYNEETSIGKLMELIDQGDEEAEAQVEAWENDPFNPHLIAGIRTGAYMRTVVMKYLENVIAWGDNLFQRDTLESLNEATQLYVLAAQILGHSPERIAKTDMPAGTFNEFFTDGLDEFSNARVAMESSLPWITTHRSGSSTGASGVLDTLYFCIPQNEKLLGYWDTVADRLFKIRNCMNIEGVMRQLALFEPPIDPGLLVKARDAGLELSNILSDSGAPLPYYRFRVMLQRSNEFCTDVKSLGVALLQALEKRDGEALSLLRATNQVDLLTSLRQLKEKAIEETQYNKQALLERKRIAEIRYEHYDSLDFMNSWEEFGVSMSKLAITTSLVGMALENFAAGVILLPQFTVGVAGFGGSPFFTTTHGGQTISNSASKWASVLVQSSSIMDRSASMAYTIASYERRQEEWDLQRDMAKKEIADIEKQILAADIRIEIVKKELASHDLQIEQNEEELEFLKSKFTNEELYGWMVMQLSTLYFQTYQMAYDLAKKTEQCFRHELGISDSNYIQFGYWDSLKKGLLAGEQLQKDLRRLDAAYLEMNRRDFELTKQISLAQINPMALLALKQTGNCEFEIPEILFDLDHSGHYMRRIKAVSLTIPCVVGPYTGVTAKLTMLVNRIRTSTVVNDNEYKYKGPDDERFAHNLVGIQSIATSTGQRDAGLFELNFGDERYLPFEGAGAISEWRLELPEEIRQFDYNTISDVILHLQYTARDGGDTLRNKAKENLTDSLNEITNILAESGTGLTRIVSAAHEFSTEWTRFMQPDTAADAQELTLKLDKRLFPFMLKDRKLDIGSITVVLILDDYKVFGKCDTLPIKFIHPDGTDSSHTIKRSDTINNLPSTKICQTFSLEEDTKEVTVKVEAMSLDGIASDLVEERDGKKRLNSGQVKDVLLIVNYTIKSE